MKKRFISTVLCAAMAASLVTGCGSGSGNASGGSTQAAADTGSKKEVVIWDYFETDAQTVSYTHLSLQWPLPSVDEAWAKVSGPAAIWILSIIPEYF